VVSHLCHSSMLLSAIGKSQSTVITADEKAAFWPTKVASTPVQAHPAQLSIKLN
jgi:hypothetical protein